MSATAIGTGQRVIPRLGTLWRDFDFHKTVALVLGIASGLYMEVMEVVFRVGIFDIDDVMLNAFGVMAGYGAFGLFQRRAQPR